MSGWKGLCLSQSFGHRNWSFWSICLHFHLLYSASASYFCICYSISSCPCSYGSLAYLLLSLRRPSPFVFHVCFHRLIIGIKGAIQSFGCSCRWTSRKRGREVFGWLSWGECVMVRSQAGEGRRGKRRGKGAPAVGLESALVVPLQSYPQVSQLLASQASPRSIQPGSEVNWAIMASIWLIPWDPVVQCWPIEESRPVITTCGVLLYQTKIECHHPYTPKWLVCAVNALC